MVRSNSCQNASVGCIGSDSRIKAPNKALTSLGDSNSNSSSVTNNKHKSLRRRHLTTLIANINQERLDSTTTKKNDSWTNDCCGSLKRNNNGEQGRSECLDDFLSSLEEIDNYLEKKYTKLKQQEHNWDLIASSAAFSPIANQNCRSSTRKSRRYFTQPIRIEPEPETNPFQKYRAYFVNCFVYI